MTEQQYPVAHPITAGAHHYFGYYDKFPWNASRRYHLATETTFIDRQPSPQDTAVLGMIDLHNGNQWHPLDETYAWNWQQGSMLQWLPSAPEDHVIYNQRDADSFFAIIRNVHTGETRRLPRPIYTVSRDGQWAISANFARLHQTRPGYGYDGLPDPYQDELTPADDGIYWMDLVTGEHRLIISLAQIVTIKPHPSMAGAKHWFNHLQINTDSSRFAFLHRWQGPEDQHWYTRLITAAPDGSDIYVVADHFMVSHYDWYSDKKVLAWANHMDDGMRYFMYTDQNQERAIIGKDVFSVDGHCSFSPNRNWMLTDTYPDSQNMRTLILYHMATGKRLDIGRFYAPPELQGPIRCDLHPRWSRDGRQISLDSVHQGTRQVYLLDVAEIVEKPPVPVSA